MSPTAGFSLTFRSCWIRGENLSPALLIPASLFPALVGPEGEHDRWWMGMGDMAG